MTPRARIAVAWDGGPGAEDALALASLLAAPTDAGVLAVHVAVPGSRDVAVPARPRFGGIAVEQRTVPAASVARGLYAVAEEERPAVLVVGSSGRGSGGRVLPGQVAERLLDGSPVPVAIAPVGFRDRDQFADLHVIGVAFEPSAEARAALSFAATIARERGALLRVIVAGGRAPSDDDIAGEFPDDVRTEVAIHDGDPVTVLLAACESDVDLLVAGSRAYGSPEAVHVGSVTGRLASMGACPLLVVPRPAPARGDTDRGVAEPAWTTVTAGVAPLP